MLSSSLNSFGATPTSGILSGYRAFNSKQAPAPQPTPIANSVIQNNTQPVKSVVHPDGSTVTYHAPEKSTPTASSPSATSSQPTAPTNTYSGLINQGANVSANAANSGANNVSTGTGILNNIATTPNPTATSAQSGLLNIAQNGTPAVNEANAALLKFQKENPYMLAAQSNPNVAADIASGRTSLLGQTFGKEEQALETGVTNALNQQGQQITAGNNVGNLALTGQGQQVTAGTNIASAGTTGQGQGINGLGTAASYAAPILGQYGQANYGVGGNSTGQVQPNDPFYKTLQSYAQQAANGQYSAIPSSITNNPVLNAQMNDMAKTINPAYNPVTSAAQSGISTMQTGNVANMTASYKSAQNLGSQLNDLISTFGINPSDVSAVNKGIGTIAQNTSSSQYKALNNLITDLVSTYSAILTPGASTDISRATAASLLDASAKGQSIIETLKNLDDQAKAKIAGQTTSYGETPSTTGGTASGNSWNDIFGNV